MSGAASYSKAKPTPGHSAKDDDNDKIIKKD